MVYHRREGEKVHMSMFFLLDKHLYSINALNNVIGPVEASKTNNVVDLKCFTDMIKWYRVIRNTLLNLMTRLFKVEKRQT